MTNGLRRLVTFCVLALPSSAWAATNAFDVPSRFETTPAESFNGVAVYLAAGLVLMALAQMQQLQRLSDRRRKIEDAVARLLQGE